jgi:hypothetical protein
MFADSFIVPKELLERHKPRRAAKKKAPAAGKGGAKRSSAKRATAKAR